MTNLISFSKYHGIGNDFIIVDAFSEQIDVPALSKRAEALCDRHFGIGADGLILVLRSDTADFKMTIINADGSVPEMCGNGLRCFAAYCFEKGLSKKQELLVETDAGDLLVRLQLESDFVKAVSVDMGTPQFDAHLHNQVEIVSYKTLDLQPYQGEVLSISMGNPHAVIFQDGHNDNVLDELGPLLQDHPYFPEGVNVGFADVIDRRHMTLRVFERGVGETLACGTGACAAVVAAVSLNRCDRHVRVELPGGPLDIEWREEDFHIIKTGPATHVYDGQLA